jgi:hypothetical protein
MAKTPTGETVPPPEDDKAPDAVEQLPAEQPPAEDPPAEPEQPPGGAYRFTGPYPATYMDRSLLAEPGETYDWPDGPPADGNWIKEN